MRFIEDPNSTSHVKDISNQNSVIYMGWYNVENPGWATDTTANRKGEAKWKILRISISAGEYTYEWADGNENFDNVWDDRAALDYSFKN